MKSCICVILVDNSNIFIQGQKHSAKLKDINGENACDPSWRISFGKLLNIVANKQPILNAIFVGSKPPLNDNVWKAAEEQGFKVVVYSRNYDNKEKVVDTKIVADGVKIICMSPEPGTLKILSGDRDFLPLIEVAHEFKWDVEMWAFKNSYNPHGEMAQAVDKINPLDDYFEDIGMNMYVWP